MTYLTFFYTASASLNAAAAALNAMGGNPGMTAVNIGFFVVSFCFLIAEAIQAR